MSAQFKVGDHVKWNSEAGYVSGKIIKVHTSNCVDVSSRALSSLRQDHLG